MYKKLLDSDIREIFRLRYDEKLTYVEIGKRLNVSRETVRYHIKKSDDSEKLYIKSVTKKKPKAVLRATRKYDFLKYLRLVMKWATENYGLSRPDVELLLYLYPEGAFTKSSFSLYYKTIGMYQSKKFDWLINNGYMTVWRPKTKDHNALYTLTNKSKRMCSDMHSFLMGDKSIPESKHSNNLAKSGKRVDRYFMDIIKEMNQGK